MHGLIRIMSIVAGLTCFSAQAGDAGHDISRVSGARVAAPVKTFSDAAGVHRMASVNGAVFSPRGQGGAIVPVSSGAHAATRRIDAAVQAEPSAWAILVLALGLLAHQLMLRPRRRGQWDLR